MFDFKESEVLNVFGEWKVNLIVVIYYFLKKRFDFGLYLVIWFLGMRNINYCWELVFFVFSIELNNRNIVLCLFKD